MSKINVGREHNYNAVYIDSDGALACVSVKNPSALCDAIEAQNIDITKCMIIRGIMYNSLYDIFGVDSSIVEKLARLKHQETQE